MSLVLAIAAAAGAAEAPPICADRPAKANAVCTVPAGKMQIESGLADWTLTKAGGTRTGVLALGSTTAKLGLTSASDLQVTVTPYTRVRVRGGGSASGFGDTIVRYKQRLSRDDAPVQVGLIPFVKIPTASHALGNGKIEGGLSVPVSFALAGPITMTLGPEADLLADADGRGRHVAIVNVVNLSAPVAPRVTLGGELWSSINFDPAGTTRQASADLALAYAVSNDLQLDAGANFGLTRNTPDVETYGGLSVRF